jgi:hypothetical protein
MGKKYPSNQFSILHQDAEKVRQQISEDLDMQQISCIKIKQLKNL